MPIETEIRSFITQDQYDSLITYFNANATLEKEDYQETFYFDCEEDLRIQKNNTGAKIWMKKGQLHDDHREEIEIPTSKEDFGKLEQLFIALGYNVEIKWFRTRNKYTWNDITVCLDYTKGYGYIIELEKMCTEQTKDEAYAQLIDEFKKLDIELTAKEEFAKQYEHYKTHWKELTQ